MIGEQGVTFSILDDHGNGRHKRSIDRTRCAIRAYIPLAFLDRSLPGCSVSWRRRRSGRSASSPALAPEEACSLGARCGG